MSDSSVAATRGRFIVFEGGEGSGKSTQAKMLADRLGAVLTREPGDTPIGARLRHLLLDPAITMEPLTEALLMAADRAEHVATVIGPALESGNDVVCDRYVGSSIAYQGYGRGLDPQQLRDTSHWAAGGLVPDLVILLAVSPEVSAQRLGSDLDRFESAGDRFHQRVREGFASQARDDSIGWATIDGERSVEDVASSVLEATKAHFNSDHHRP